MIKDLPGEQWKAIKFDFEFTNDSRIDISNFGRLRTFNKISDGNIINGSMINGYRIIRLKFYKPRDRETQNRLDYLQKQVFSLSRKLKSLKSGNTSKKTLDATSELLQGLKKKLSKKFQDDLKERTINYHSLIHRLVADYFLKKPAPGQTIVAHLDYDKLNNRAGNLKWMTAEENYEHQKSSPFVIKEKQERRHKRKENSKATKLTVTKVMLLKKLLNQGKPMKQLVKQFKVTDTQILRIKRGENWPDIQAAN
ncbi:MAG: HNH endonuclease [Bacteroidetes bacterium]|nr:HNH endonuclease [Bacteroidota bacterium]MBS1973494.1 HNH endonuclease [Bacteroidota bacterium]